MFSNKFRGALRVIPAIVITMLLAWITLALDAALDPPFTIATGSARVLFGATFSALVTVGAFAFWMRPIIASLTAASMPPRGVSVHLYDRFQHRVVATTASATAYQATILLSLPSNSDLPAPPISTVMAAALGVGAIGSLLVAIRHAERSTRPAALVAETARDVIERIRRSSSNSGGLVESEAPGQPDGEGYVIAAPKTGWIQWVDEEALLQASPQKSHVRLEVGLGAFVVANSTPLCTVDGPRPSEDNEVRMQERFKVADERPHDIDLLGSVTHFTDIAVHTLMGMHKSMSTMYETIGYLGAVLHVLVEYDLRGQDMQLADGRTLQQGPGPDGAGLAELGVRPNTASLC